MLTTITQYCVTCDRCNTDDDTCDSHPEAERSAIRHGFAKQRDGGWLCKRCRTNPEPEDMKHLRELYGLNEWELPAFLHDADERRRMLAERPYLRLLAEDLEHLIPFYEVFP